MVIFKDTKTIQMRSILVAVNVFLFTLAGSAQLTITKADGGSVVTKLGMGIKINDGSSLHREYITINDANCPVQLNDVGIETSYASSYSFRPIGGIEAKDSIVAYEVDHVLYNIFGEHMKSLSDKEVTDIIGKKNFSKYSSWYASENDVSEYLICVSYAENVRTKSGVIWHYSYKAIKEQLDTLKIAFEEGYAPKKDPDKKN